MNEQIFQLGNIDNEEVKRLTNFLNGIPNKDNLYLKVYINSTGGSIVSKDIIVSMINEQEHEIHIETAESAALELVTELKGAIYFLPLAHGMYHLGTTYIPYRDGLTETNETRAKLQFCKGELGRTMRAMTTLKVTDEERDQILNGLDVYFSRERLVEMFSDRDAVSLQKKHEESLLDVITNGR